MNPDLGLRDLLSTYVHFKILRPATVMSYQDAIRNVERFAGSSVPLQSLTVNQLLAHRSWALSNIRPTSYNKHRRHLRALLNFALAEGMLASQPFNKVGPAPTGARRPKTVPVGWYKKTMNLLDGEDVRGLGPAEFWRTVFSVFHFTSMRRRQLVELRWGHFLPSRSALLLSSDGSKSMREWLVPIPGWLTKELLELRRWIELASGIKPGDSDQIFFLPALSPRIKVACFEVGHVNRAFEALSAHLGVRISSHRVRHTSATVMLEKTGNIKAVSDMLGHSDIKLTASTYIHPGMGSLRRLQKSLAGYAVDDLTPTKS